MSAFRDDGEDHARLDFRLLQLGPVAMYLNRSILAEDVTWFRGSGYVVDMFDASAWRTEGDALRKISQRLAFPEHFGRNLDALNDCLLDIAIPDLSGRALVFEQYDTAAAQLGDFASVLLDVFATQSRWHLLHGRRLLVLVHTNDPRLSFPPVAACPVSWNPREWLNSARGV